LKVIDKTNLNILTFFKTRFFHLLFWVFLASSGILIRAQDSISKPPEDSVFMYTHSPQKASLLSAALPGLGQIYNHKYWKAPLVYIGFGTLAYFIRFNNKEYNHFKKAYLYKVDDDPTTIDPYAEYSATSVKNAMDTYRRWRDMNVLGAAGFYLLQVIDATVDAYLFEFDISRNLTMTILPDMNQNCYLAGYSAGVTCVITLKP